jgi:hypothetical protein
MTIATSDVSTDPQNVASEDLQTRGNDGELVSWVMSRVLRWRTTRDSNYFDLWDQYWAIWRGQWNAKLKQRDSERSRLIAPATQQAVDATVSEMVEATFGRGSWFDIREQDGVDPKEQAAAENARNTLLYDFQKDKVKHAIIEAYFNGAIYGTGIAKRIVEEKKVQSMNLDSYGNPQTSDDQHMCISWQAIPPYNFVIDTAALSVEEAQGVAHETVRPIDEIEQKQSSGEYFQVPIGSASGYATGIIARGPKGENLEVNILDSAYICEYHGRVPKKYFDEQEEDTPLTPYAVEDMSDQHTPPEEMVEAIIVIANGNSLLKKQLNPFPNGDRGFIAYQHDRVPNRFWGRGVVEKAYNSQLALDAELRGRIDAMALMTYPVVGFDATRLPRNLNLQVRPGKAFLTNGDPETIIRPIQFGNLNPAWFQQSGDLERMVQLATGTFDPGGDSPAAGAASASGASMSMAAMLKRSKLTMQTIDVDFLDPLVKKTYLAYQLLDPKRYPTNQEFIVQSSTSILAREFEQTQMTNLLAIIPPGTPAFNIVLKAIIENYSGPSREEAVNAIDQMMQPNPQQQQAQQKMQEIQMQGAIAEVQKLMAEVEKLKSELPVNQAKTAEHMAKAQSIPVTTHIQAVQTGVAAAEAQHARIQTGLDHVQHHKDHAHDIVKLHMEDTQHGKELKIEQEKHDKDREMESHQRDKDRAVMQSMGAAQMDNDNNQASLQRGHETKSQGAEHGNKVKLASMKPKPKPGGKK